MKMSWFILKRKLRNKTCAKCGERIDLELPFIIYFGKRLKTINGKREGWQRLYEPTRLYCIECKEAKKKWEFTLINCFKTIFSRENLGKEAGKEHIRNNREKRSK